MQVLGFVLFAVTRILASFFELKIHAHAHKKGALFFTYTSFKATVSGGTKTFQKQKPFAFPTMLSLPNMPGMTTTGCSNGGGGAKQHQVRRRFVLSSFECPHFFFAFFVSREREREGIY